ncbi:hypothetical protein ASC80_07005 [Afipia sp. Root123D2]|uniref:hypothetical protein n=1 Tax=Afipia sp. Root123D2 TaxID=1736436 RepID=UPI0006FB1058|nr:hypothetical protein [Afipia sp. Root123D2]KQW23060.1 hypothetical protein ASC80_07005 [Afipia sp. Root123D2]
MVSLFRIALSCALPVCALFLIGTIDSAKAEDTFRLSNNQRISCSRGLSAGKLQNIKCKSYAYIFNTKTSEFYRCEVSVAVTRDNKEVLKIDTGGGCALKARIFPEDSTYSFDANETEPPNTNSFFGAGGTAIWASDSTKLKARGCIELVVGVAPDVLKCVDMTFDTK